MSSGQLSHFLEGLDRPPLRVRLGRSLGLAGEHADMRRTDDHRAGDPRPRQLEFLLPIRTRRQREGVADRRSTDADPAQEGVPLNLPQVGIGRRILEVVTRQFRPVTSLLRAVIEETEHVHLRRHPILPLHELVAERIGGERQTQPRRPFPRERFNTQSGYLHDRNRAQKGAP